MMISPNSYVEFELKGKTREQALNEVRSLKKEIRRLEKVIMEEPESEEMMVHPMPNVRLSVSIDYLSATRKYFESMGWEYELSEEEKAEDEFNRRLQDIDSIEVNIGGYFEGGEYRKVTFDGEKVIDEHKFSCRTEPLKETDEGLAYLTKEEILEELSDLHMGRWKKDYDNPDVLDGTSWDVTIKYDNGKKWKSGGCNAFPYNFSGFLDIMDMSELDI